jgi:hypothetical protein
MAFSSFSNTATQIPDGSVGQYFMPKPLSGTSLVTMESAQLRSSPPALTGERINEPSAIAPVRRLHD